MPSADCAAEQTQYKTTTVQHGSDSEVEPEAQIGNSFIGASGICSVQKITNFTASKIEKLYRDCKTYVNERSH